MFNVWVNKLLVATSSTFEPYSYDIEVQNY